MAIGPQDNLLKILLSPKCNSCNKQTNATIPQTMQVLEAIADVYQGWVGRGEGENPRDPPLTQLTQKCTIMQHLHCTLHNAQDYTNMKTNATAHVRAHPRPLDVLSSATSPNSIDKFWHQYMKLLVTGRTDG